MRDDSSVERFLGNDNDKIGFHFGVIIAACEFSRKKFQKLKIFEKNIRNSDFIVWRPFIEVQ